MKKAGRLICFICTLCCVTGLCSCGKSKPHKGEEGKSLISYDKLYDGASKEKHEIVKTGDVNRASYGYKFNSEQGYNGWCYVYGHSNATATMTYSEEAFHGTDGASICDGVVKPVTEAGYLYIIPADGNYIFGGTFKKATADGQRAKLAVYSGTTQFFPIAEDEFAIDGNDLTGRYFEGCGSFKAGDEVYFCVSGGSAYLNPAIRLGNFLNDSLYDSRNSWNYYGDVHVYWYKNTVNLFHLRNLGGNTWQWYLKKSTDMFRFYDVPYDNSFVDNHYMAYEKAGDLIDYSQYIGGRDGTKFYDADIDRCRFLTLSYKTKTGNVNCDLTLRTSEDSIGFDWQQPCKVLRAFPDNSGEPECSGLRKIGNRWYLYTGISGQSAHNVGRLSYWIGGEGQTIDEVDWPNLPTHYLDGEDLCVPQIEAIEDRFYMYGWMPQAFNAGLWGGYMNLPREVYALPDGTLAVRLDEKATSLVNKGRYFDVGSNTVNIKNGDAQISDGKVTLSGRNNSVVFNKTANSSFITFDLDMKDSTSAGFLMQTSANEYHVELEKFDDKTYMRIYNATNGYLSSDVPVGDNTMRKFSVKLTVDGGIIEFFVNDTMALSGRTSMSSKNFYGGFYSNGGAEFTNITVNRLAQFYDIYD